MDVKAPLPAAAGSLPPGAPRRPKTPREAAEQFEQVLARQFVQAMTEDLFQNSLASEGGPTWMQGYQDTQRDLLTEALTEHLVESGALRLSDLLLRQWNGSDATETGGS